MLSKGGILGHKAPQRKESGITLDHTHVSPWIVSLMGYGHIYIYIYHFVNVGPPDGCHTHSAVHYWSHTSSKACLSCLRQTTPTISKYMLHANLLACSSSVQSIWRVSPEEEH